MSINLERSERQRITDNNYLNITDVPILLLCAETNGDTRKIDCITAVAKRNVSEHLSIESLMSLMSIVSDTCCFLSTRCGVNQVDNEIPMTIQNMNDGI